jgi:hypothetical protein
MSRLIHCRRCGVLFVPDQRSYLFGWRRLCPRCRGPLPPSGGLPAIDSGLYQPHSWEAPV